MSIVIVKNVLYVTTIAISALILLVIILLAQHAAKCYFVYKTFTKHKIPGPKPTLFFGNYFHMNKGDVMPHEQIGIWLKQYGKAFGYFDGFYPTMVIHDVEIIKEIMIRQCNKFTYRHLITAPVKPIIDSILAYDGQKWKDCRSLMTPAFSTSKLKSVVHTMNKHADNFITAISRYSSHKGEIEICRWCNALTLDVIAECALALNANSLSNPKDKFLTAVEEYFRFAKHPGIVLSGMFPFLSYLICFINNFLTAGRMTDTILKNLKNAIKTRRNDNNKRRRDLLQLLLDAELNPEETNGAAPTKSLSDVQVIANAHLFMLAGFETTANSLGYVFYSLCVNPDIQERAYREVVSTLDNSEGISYEQVQRLNYMEQVINETLRIHPPVALFINRVSKEDCVINDIFIPKNVVVQVPVWQLHHDPNLWDEPEKFNPERFSTENKANIIPGSFMAFGIGPRNCVGVRFAMMEMKIALAKVLLKYKICRTSVLDEPLEIINSTVFLKPLNGIALKFQPR